MAQAMKYRNGAYDANAPYKRPEKADVQREQEPKKDVIDKLPGNSQAQYFYYEEDGKLAFIVQRYIIEGKKVFGQYTPDGNGKWIKGLTIPKNRPLYNLKAVLESDPSRQVMVVEGEKCVEAVKDNFKTTVVCTWACGSKSVRLNNWQPLYGRQVMLVADSDPHGYLAMADLARHLVRQQCKVSLVLPKLSWDRSFDIADQIEIDPKSVPGWIKQHIMAWSSDADERMHRLAKRVEQRRRAELDKVKAFRTLHSNPQFKVLERTSNNLTIEITGYGVKQIAKKDLKRIHVLLSVFPKRAFWDEVIGAELRRSNLDTLDDLVK